MKPKPPEKKLRSKYLGIRLEPELFQFVVNASRKWGVAKSQVAREAIMHFNDIWKGRL